MRLRAFISGPTRELNNRGLIVPGCVEGEQGECYSTESVEAGMHRLPLVGPEAAKSSIPSRNLKIRRVEIAWCYEMSQM